MKFRKMKKIKKRLIFTLSLLLIYSGYLVYRHYHVHNIFDEIYYNQKNSWAPALESIDVINNPVSDNAGGGNKDREVYALDSLPSVVVNVEYSFNFSKEYVDHTQFAIIITQLLDDNKTAVTSSYIYYSREKVLERILWVEDGLSNITSEKEKVDAVLEANNTTRSKFAETSDNLLKTIVLNDWCSVYNSRFSPDDWGDVTVETQWED